MTTAQHDITIDQGATFELGLTWTDNAAVPVDMTGATARMMVRRRHKDDTVLLSLTSASGITINVATGRIDVVATATLTAALPAPLTGVYDLEVEFDTGRVVRLVQGATIITPEVTR